MTQFQFLSQETIYNITAKYKTPVYVYSEKELKTSAEKFLSFPSAFGHDVRYAMKANANINILKIFKKQGIKIDAGSPFEVERALYAGFDGSDIQLSSQESAKNLEYLLEKGVFFVATSLHQIEQIGKLQPGASIGIRLNPGMGSGAFQAIATGGVTSSFGIWHEHIPEIKRLAESYHLKITKIHIHIGSENTPESWMNSANIGLSFVDQFDDVDILDLGGGFKKAIMPYEKDADLKQIGESVSKQVTEFYEKTGRKIRLELEPGKYLVICAGCVIAEIDDIVDTGESGYNFIRLNTGMTEMPRVAMYGVQQPIKILNHSTKEKEYVVVGHCCESGDILTSKLYESETIEPILLPEANIGDTVVIEGTGAYNSAMSMKNYNSFPEAGELLLRDSGEIVEIRKRQELSDIWKYEREIL